MQKALIKRMLAADALIGRCAYPKPGTEAAENGVSGGIVIAASPDGAELIVAIHGRLDDLLTLEASQTADIDDEDWWDLSEGRSANASRDNLDAAVGDDYVVHPHVHRLIGRGTIAAMPA